MKLFIALFLIGCGQAAAGVAPCRIEVIEKGSGWPVPLVELRTTHQVRFFSDNAGVIAFDLPELMGQEVWFDVIGNGYEVPKDGFGYRGVRLVPEPGKTLKVEMNRTLIARRLGRITGSGLFSENARTGGEAFGESGIVGCDSVMTAMHRGRLFWLWGDTTLARYPLGIFHSSSATTEPRPLRSFEPPVRLEFDYFRDERKVARGVAKMPGSGPTWLTGYMSLRDREGRERLVASYVKINPPLEAYEIGLCVWNDETAQFDQERVLWTKSEARPKQPLFPEGHATFWTDADGKDWVLFGNPFPKVRCRANFEAWQSGQWEELKPQETVPAADGAVIRPHTGSIAWNAWRQKWVTVFMEALGKPSAFGELWYAEAPSPEGPWGPAVKVLTHENYTFYNPKLHPQLGPENSPVLLFEGTYTAMFADRPTPTPRYDYNQILYRLDLDDPRLDAARQGRRN